jgi:hypothetical protein
MRRVLVASAFALAAMAMPVVAAAAPITGFISFGGAYTPVDGGGAAVAQSVATGVDVTGDVAVVSCALSASCLGTYAPVTGLVAATYNDFQFNPLGGSVSPLWTFTHLGVTYTFDLATVNIDVQDDVFLTLTGTGTLHATGFDDTFGRWSFSGDTTNGAQFAFSSTNSVPEPASLMLFSLGIFGAAGVARRRMRRA